MQNKDKCIAIFKTFMKIGAFTFGGGYAMLPMIERSMVQQKKWITEEEMTDMVAISEATPGPIMVNLATFVGSKIAGVPGAIMATLGDCSIILCNNNYSYVYETNKRYDACKIRFCWNKSGGFSISCKSDRSCLSWMQ